MTGSIQNIKGKIVTIRYREAGLCVGCLNKHCKGQGCLITAENTKGLPLSLGQIVTVRTSLWLLAKQILGALVPPVFGFIAGFMALRLCFSRASEALQVICGLGGLCTAAFIVYRIRLRFPAQYNEVSYPTPVKDLPSARKER